MTTSPSAASGRSTQVVLAVAVAVVVVAATAYLLVQRHRAGVYEDDARSAATATAQGLTAVLDDLGTSPAAGFDDPGRVQEAYTRRLAGDGVEQVPDDVEVSFFHGRTEDDATTGFYACARSTRSVHLPGDDGPQTWCVPLDQPDAAPSEAGDGGFYDVLEH